MSVDSPSSPSLGAAELEERVAPRLGDVLLECVVDADPILPEEGDGWPPARSEQRTKQARAPVRLERASQDGSRLLGREFDGLNRYATTVIRNGRLAGRPKVCRPASRAVRRLDEPAAVELEQADRYRARLARPPTALTLPPLKQSSGHRAGPSCGKRRAGR